MKTAAFLAIIAFGAQCATGFTTSPNFQLQSTTSTTVCSMGLFDFFSEDARKEREERKQREVEEQERYQREIIARRSNPDKMEEYEARVRVRRQLRMNGEDEAADAMDMYSGDDEKIVGLN
eukprot:CAMPEP_0196233276 /NCGR_PEP_ID=MMETSP0913-20130531/3724_1 /TAXON_ID=49265 /ORGANISM="Thalassiosira rotula, Strain GSO102" /LENGTH=120 /DNA_ID=CAMNT_0041514057 /DNA_START=13 /DNA_END=375 /DNA_ORIENTATION=-